MNEYEVMFLFFFSKESISATSAQPRIIDVLSASWRVELGIWRTILFIISYIWFITTSSGRLAPKRNSGTVKSDFKMISFVFSDCTRCVLNDLVCSLLVVDEVLVVDCWFSLYSQFNFVQNYDVTRRLGYHMRRCQANFRGHR